MTIRTHDHDSTDTKLLSTRLFARLGLALAVLVATATAGIGAAAALPGEAKPPTGVGLSTPAPSGADLADSEAAPGTVIQSEVVGMNEEYIAVEVQFPNDVFSGEEQFPDDVFVGEEQFPDDTFERAQNNLIVDRDAVGDDGLPGLEFPDDTFADEEQFPDDTFADEEQFPDDTFAGEEEFPDDLFVGEDLQIKSEVIPPRGTDNVDAGRQVSNSDHLSVSDLAYLAPVDKRKAVGDGEMPILTPVAIGWGETFTDTGAASGSEQTPASATKDFGNPHDVIMYFNIEDGSPEEYLSSAAADGGLGVYLMASQGWWQPTQDGDSAIDPAGGSIVGGSGPLTTPQEGIPVPGGMP